MRKLLLLVTLASSAYGASELDRLSDQRRDNAAPTVIIPQGTLVGVATAVPGASSVVNKFLGIPFAVTPPKRFEPPVPIGPSSVTYDASRWSPKCFEQTSGGPLVDDAPESEDCLYLNVYAPSSGSSNKTVLFWIYGGNLRYGNAGQANYDGTYFAAYHDVVLVAANYRTNVFGFSNCPELPIESRNVGFLDQRLALQWVKENVAAFGGSPEKVTIFGESSGASSVDRLLTSPPNPLPFRAAILQSGQASLSVSSNRDGPKNWETLVNALDCGSSSRPLDCVQQADPFVIKRLIQSRSLYFPPVNDEMTQKATPLVSERRSGQAANIPLLVGSNGLEGSLILQPLWKSIHERRNVSGVLDDLAGTIGSAAAQSMWTRVQHLISKTSMRLFYDLSAIITDVIYTCPASSLAKASASANNPTWRYWFNASFPNTQAPFILPQYGLNDIGAFHSSEIPIVFGTYSSFDKYALSTTEQMSLSRQVQKAWADFAHNPSQGPGWASTSSTDYIGCLGCEKNISGISLISVSDVDQYCLLYDLFYNSRMPLF